MAMKNGRGIFLRLLAIILLQTANRVSAQRYENIWDGLPIKILRQMRVGVFVLPLFGCSFVDVPGNVSFVAATNALDRRDYSQAFDLLSGLLDRGGFHDATSVKVMLGELYLNGRGTQKDVGKGISLLKEAAESEEDLNWAVIAQNKLAVIYEFGKEPEIEQNKHEAALWYQKASRHGSESATSALARLKKQPYVYVELYPDEFARLPFPSTGNLNTVSNLIKTQPNLAVKIVRWHAHAGDQNAQVEYARLLYSGKVTQKNLDAAMRWLYLAAKNGHPDAQYFLANEYRRGEVVDISFEAHEKWLMAAAAQDHPNALNELGTLRLKPLKKGQGRDPEAAFEFFKKAAALENVFAIANLGDLYSEGIGTKKDLNKAKELYQRAAAAGNKTAIKRLQEIDGISKPVETERIVVRERIIVQKAPNKSPSAESIFNQHTKSVFQVLVASVKRRDGKLLVTGEGSGSAVAVSANHALTNCHVVKGKSVILIKFEGKLYDADVVHRNVLNDVCIIKVSDTSLHAIKKSRAFKNLNVGETVYAIGSPAGLENSISQGIISGKRKIKGKWWIQTTAAISPGSSGGGLFDKDGNLIGITTFKISGKSDEGLNFASPALSFFELARAL